jgi:hypothetical protein
MRAATVEPTNRPEVVVVTGASAGLGRAIVREFARHGAMVGLIARDRARLDSAAQDVADLGGKAVPIAADVANALAVDQAADQIERELGPVDIWVNNAMTTVFANFEEPVCWLCISGAQAINRNRPRSRQRRDTPTICSSLYLAVTRPTEALMSVRSNGPRNCGLEPIVGYLQVWHAWLLPLRFSGCGDGSTDGASLLEIRHFPGIWKSRRSQRGSGTNPSIGFPMNSRASGSFSSEIANPGFRA